MRSVPAPRRAVTAGVACAALTLTGCGGAPPPSGPAPAPTPGVAREDYTVRSDPGVELGVRAVTRGETRPETPVEPVVLVHGARVPGIPSFDLDVPGGSLAGDMARPDRPLFVMDVRGYGRSTRPPEMAGPTADGTPVVRSPEAVRDIAAVVDDTRRRTGASRVAVVGWAVGGSWAAEYAAAHPDAVSDLVLFNSMTGFATQPRYGVGSANSDPADPNVYRRDAGAYGLATPEAMLSTWDSSIPAQDKSEWRDPAVAEAYVRTALDSDETSGTRQPESMRAPNGAQLDTFHLASGRPTFDPTSIRSRVLIVRSELDFWSSPEDPDGLRQRLTGAQEARVVTIAGATHYLHLDRPEYGAERFRAELDTFLNRGA